MENKKILISGGGIAGVSLAVFLKDSGFDVTIIERGNDWRTIGFAIGMWKPGLDILESLGADDAFWEKTHVIRQGAFLDKNDAVLVGFPCQTKPAIARTMLREDLHAFLRSKLSGKEKVRFNTSIQQIENSPTGARVHFSDGSSKTFDLVVAADGVRSPTRELIFKNSVKRYGWSGWATWEPSQLSHFDGYYLTSEPGYFFLSLPYKDRVTAGFMHVADSFDPNLYTKEKLEKAFSRFPFVRKHAKSAVTQERIFCDDMVFVQQKEWYQGRVVLIGDSKHSVSPISGFGTTLALGDAKVLAEELTRYADVSNALVAFSKRRTHEIKNVQTVIRLMEKFVMIKNPLVVKVRNVIVRCIPGSLFSRWLVSVF